MFSLIKLLFCNFFIQFSCGRMSGTPLSWDFFLSQYSFCWSAHSPKKGYIGSRLLSSPLCPQTTYLNATKCLLAVVCSLFWFRFLELKIEKLFHYSYIAVLPGGKTEVICMLTLFRSGYSYTLSVNRLIASYVRDL